jgi:hypothetical protein
MAVTACAGTQGDLLSSTPDANVGGDSAPPPPILGVSWQIQLTGMVNTTVNVQLYTVDYETPAPVIRDLHVAGRIVICYFSAGTFEPFRPDAARFPTTAMGAPLQGYPDERWIDIRNDTVRSIMQDRISAAAASGCDGIHPSGLAGFQEATGLTFTRDDQLAYDRWLAGVSHGSRLSMGLVEGDAALSQDLVPDFDWVVVWSCLDTQCAAASPFLNAGKTAFLVEIGDASRAPQVCPAAKGLGLSAVIKHQSLDAYRGGCP